MWLGQTAPLHNTLLLGLGKKETEKKNIYIQFALIAALSSFDLKKRPVRRRLQKLKDV